MISKGLLVLTKTRRGPLRKKVIEAWKAPPLNMVKINWDAALDQQNQVVGLGQSFPPNWVGGISFNLIYKNDMCHFF
jgi:hypothetical protein